MDLLKSKLSEISGGKILDVATYKGSFIKDLLEAFKDYDEAIGIDISDKQFAEARKNFANYKVSFQKMDSVNLLFDNETFNATAMAHGLHHLADIRASLSEMKRTLKPGGIFVIYESFSDNQSEKQLSDVYRHHFNIKIDRIKGKLHYPTLKRQEIIDYIEELGLNSYETYDYHCDRCNPEEEDKLNERIKDIDESLDEIKNHPQYKQLKLEAEQLKRRFRVVGYDCATNLIIIGVK